MKHDIETVDGPGNDLGRAIHEEITRKGISVEAFSKYIGSGPQYIGQITRGFRRPSLPMLLKIADHLGLRVRLEFVPKPGESKAGRASE